MAIEAAERLLPGQKSVDGKTDPRWQSIINVAEFIDTEPGAVWDFTATWGSHPDNDLRAAMATCLLEHLLERHFETFFEKVETLVRSNRLFAGTFSMCVKFGQSKEPSNSRRFDGLKREASRYALPIKLQKS